MLRRPAPPRPAPAAGGEGLSSYRSDAYWAEQPSNLRRFAPLAVIFAIAAGALVAMDYKFRHEDDGASAPLAQGPAVESLVENAPPAAGPADPASSVVDSAGAAPAEPPPAMPPTVAPPAGEQVPALSTPPRSRPAPLPRPNDNDAVRPPQPDQPSRLPEPEVTEPSLDPLKPPMPSLQVPATLPTPTPTPAEPAPPPSVEPSLQPAPVPLPVPEGTRPVPAQ